jgi:hypothetical protein
MLKAAATMSCHTASIRSTTQHRLCMKCQNSFSSLTPLIITIHIHQMQISAPSHFVCVRVNSQ